MMIVDDDLVRRLEATAAQITLATVAELVAHAADDPARAAPFGAGALAAFGSGRYVNRAIGVSLDDIDDEGLDEVEAFYAAAGLAPSLEVASWAPRSLVRRLAARGYSVAWFRNVYALAPEDAMPIARPNADVRVVDERSIDEWLAVRQAAFELTTDGERAMDAVHARAAHAVAGNTDFLLDVDGVAAGCGSLTCQMGVGWLGGAGTVPGERRRGVQTSLVRHRMAVAAKQGCDIVAATAGPPGESARNLARLGFTLVYTQVAMTKDEP